jgi:hypothetical protein
VRATAVILVALLGGAAIGEAQAQAPGAMAQTLLVPRPAAGALEFLDPGSGLRLAFVLLDTGPQRVAVSPDGRLAAVLGCTRPDDPAGPVALSIVDLEHPRELRRFSLGHRICPASLAWFETHAVALYDDARDSATVVDTQGGGSRVTQSRNELATIERALRNARIPDRTTIAVQQFLADNGRLADLAVTPVLPRATCHACTPAP